jgi:hypothetical protein
LEQADDESDVEDGKRTCFLDYICDLRLSASKIASNEIKYRNSKSPSNNLKLIVDKPKIPYSQFNSLKQRIESGEVVPQTIQTDGRTFKLTYTSRKVKGPKLDRNITPLEKLVAAQKEMLNGENGPSITKLTDDEHKDLKLLSKILAESGNSPKFMGFDPGETFVLAYAFVDDKEKIVKAECHRARSYYGPVSCLFSNIS